MKKVVVILAALAMCFLMVGCVSVNQPIAATSNPVGAKVGSAKGVVFFTWLGVGSGIGRADVGIQKAAQNGGITKISTVDFSTSSWFSGFFTTYNTTVTGE